MTTGRPAEPQMAELWLVDTVALAETLEALESAVPSLSADDEARLASRQDAAARRERRVSHIALRLCLERFVGPTVRGQPYVWTPSGRPELEGSGVSFSLSHTKGVALIGVTAAGVIGVDIERRRLVRIMAERRHAIEHAAVDLAKGAELPEGVEPRFLTAWVRLEAVAKAEGSGVGAHLSVLLGRRASLPPQRMSPLKGSSRAPGPLVARDLAPGRGLYAAVALPEGLRTPPLRQLPATLDALAGLVSGKGPSASG